MMITPTDPHTGCPNPGLVPPWLQFPVVTLPMPPGWTEPDEEFWILTIGELAPPLRGYVR